MIRALLTCVSIICYSWIFSQDQVKVNQDLAAFILQMKQEDQLARKSMAMSWKSSAEAQVEPSDKVKMQDEKHRIQMDSLIQIHGFPYADIVGMEATHGFWVLCMHQDGDTAFQAHLLELMELGMARNTVLNRDIAYLRDRVSVNARRCQVYGTQVDFDSDLQRYVSFPICDKRAMKRQRKAMDLMPLKKQMKQENKKS